MVLLGVNVDHVATIRQARGTSYPDPVEAAICSIRGGADQITIHLREDRRHIQDRDLERMKISIEAPLNLEMAAVDEIVDIAIKTMPSTVTLVPEKREELTTEGGLNVLSNTKHLKPIVARLMDAGITVSMFIDPENEQIDATLDLGTKTIELHTGAFCDAVDGVTASRELERLIVASRYASSKLMKVCAGHGLNYENTRQVVNGLPAVTEYNIGHSIIARSIRVGIESAVREMRIILEGGI